VLRSSHVQLAAEKPRDDRVFSHHSYSGPTFAPPPSGVATSSTSFGWGKGENVRSAGWQVTLCDRVWHVSSRSGLLYCVYLDTKGTKVCQYNWHSAGSVGRPFPMLKYKCIFQIKYTETILSKQHSETVMV